MKPTILKDLITGLWHVEEGDMVFPAASWGEALQFVHDMGKHHAQVRPLTKPEIVVEEYEHFSRILGPTLAKQRLETLYNISPRTVNDYLRRARQ